MRSIFFFLVVLLCNGLFARIIPPPGYFEINFEALWLQPLIPLNYYGVSAGLTGQLANGEYYNNTFDYKFAYRIEGLYSFCNECNFVLARWTHLPERHTRDHKENNSICLTQSYPALQGSGSLLTSINSRIDFKFTTFDLLFGQRICACGCFDLFLEGGFLFAQIKRKDLINASIIETENGGGQLSTSYLTDFWGIGPELGLDGYYYFPCCCNLYIYGDASFAFLISKNHHKSKFSAAFLEGPPLPSIFVDPNDLWKGVPAGAIRFGVGYTSCLPCLCGLIYSIDAGYQLFHFSNAIQRIVFYGSTVSNRSDDFYSDVTLHGPYFSVSVAF